MHASATPHWHFKFPTNLGGVLHTRVHFGPFELLARNELANCHLVPVPSCEAWVCIAMRICRSAQELLERSLGEAWMALGAGRAREAVSVTMVAR
jgi:hypothetical protein